MLLIVVAMVAWQQSHGKKLTAEIDRKDLPSAGAGEASIIGIAPAIRNAILDATGTALNTLPMLPNGVLS